MSRFTHTVFLKVHVEAKDANEALEIVHKAVRDTGKVAANSSASVWDGHKSDMENVHL